MALIEDAGHTAIDPDTRTPLLVLASCPVENPPEGATRLSGKLKVRIKPNTRAFEAYGTRSIAESFNCNYELNPEYRRPLERSGLMVSGVSGDGGARIIELPPPSWHLATGFLPQLSSEPGMPHPLIVAYLEAALALKKLKTKGAERPETLENRWDILYRDYPEAYEEFASVPYSKSWLDAARRITGFRGKVVADIGSGTGKSTFEVARYPKQVIGIEPEDAMRKIAMENAAELGLSDVSFLEGRAERIPLADNAVDITIAVTAASFYNKENVKSFSSEAERITRKGGHILVLESAPGWYGGELAHVILGKRRTTWTETWKDRIFEELGFKRRDFYLSSDYGTVEKAIRTYGFIFGKKAIDYLRAHGKTTIKWKARIYYKQLSP
ncbi:MAG: hypothetical protein A2147_07270 [Chloroflexi bacterium RBG_16_57_8]|nr:MAG: hypothetical protein A2147_07270 [Chloroflexi bacterium RBG_16_57_8]